MRERAKNTTLMQQIEKLEKNQRSSATNGVGPLMSRSTSATSEALEAQIKQTVMAEDMLVAGMVTNTMCSLTFSHLNIPIKATSTSYFLSYVSSKKWFTLIVAI